MYVYFDVIFWKIFFALTLYSVISLVMLFFFLFGRFTLVLKFSTYRRLNCMNILLIKIELIILHVYVCVCVNIGGFKRSTCGGSTIQSHCHSISISISIDVDVVELINRDKLIKLSNRKLKSWMHVHF